MKKPFKILSLFVLCVMVVSLIVSPVLGKTLPNDRRSNDAASQDINIEVDPPGNDSFAEGALISGESGTVSGSSVGATAEVDETNPWPDASQPEASVWWTWQAPSTGTYAFDSTGNFYNFICVFTGTVVTDLTVLAGNEYVDYDLDTIDRIVFKATEGVTYHIAVYGYLSDLGTIDLSWSKVTPPTNDDFANAIAISAASGTAESSNYNATVEADEMANLYTPGKDFIVNSVWWKWTAPSTGSFTFDTIGSGLIDTMLDVYSGTSFETFSLIIHNDDRGVDAWSMLKFDATEGESYSICALGYGGCKGAITLNWYENQAPSITSVDHTTFEVGTFGSFTLTATGLPSPNIFKTSGALPAGVYYDSSTKTLSGTPVAGTGGVYNLVFTASNGVGSNDTQNFTLTVNQAPAITSTNQATFALGVPGTFTLVATGYPAPSVELTSGTLPAGITYDSATKQLSGTASGTDASIPLVFTASNGIGSPAVQNFWLFTHLAAPEITVQPHNLMATTNELAFFSVTATGSPTLTYQWQVCTSARRNIWTDILGATDSVYTTPQATLKMNGYLYRVVVTNSVNSVTSDAATLTVYSAPTSSSNVEVDVTGTFDSASQNITWTIGLHSLGPDNAEGVLLTNTLAKFTRLVSIDLSSISGATYKLQGSKVIVDLGTLAGDCEFTLTTAVGRATSPTSHTVSATTTSYDTDLTNNIATYEVIWP